jgi:hypothetical protein
MQASDRSNQKNFDPILLVGDVEFLALPLPLVVLAAATPHQRPRLRWQGTKCVWGDEEYNDID